jgi:hypothetical protein
MRSEIHKLRKSVWNNEELPQSWEQSVIVPLHVKGDKAECRNGLGISLLSITSTVYPTSFCQG